MPLLVLRCVECGRLSEDASERWKAYLTLEDDDREFGRRDEQNQC